MGQGLWFGKTVYNDVHSFIHTARRICNAICEDLVRRSVFGVLPHFMHESICRPWPFKAFGLQDKRLRTAFRTFESCELRAFCVLQFALVTCANTSFAIVRMVDGWPCLLDH